MSPWGRSRPPLGREKGGGLVQSKKGLGVGGNTPLPQVPNTLLIWVLFHGRKWDVQLEPEPMGQKNLETPDCFVQRMTIPSLFFWAPHYINNNFNILFTYLPAFEHKTRLWACV